MSLTTAAALAVSPEFLARVRMACTVAAVGVLKRAESSDAAKTGAKYFLRQPDVLADRIAWMVAANPTIDASATDEAIQTLIAASWPVLAEVLL